MTPFYLQSLVTKMAKNQRNTEPQPLILFNYISCNNKRKENKFERVLDPWSWVKDISLKKGCFRDQFLKTPSETALFGRTVNESYGSQIQIKENNERKIYSNQTKGQLGEHIINLKQNVYKIIIKIKIHKIWKKEKMLLPRQSVSKWTQRASKHYI